MFLDLASVTGTVITVNATQVVMIRDGTEAGLVDVVLSTGETVVARGRTGGVASLLEQVAGVPAGALDGGNPGRYSERPESEGPAPATSSTSSAPPPRFSGVVPAGPPREPQGGSTGLGRGQSLTPFQGHRRKK